MEKSFWNDRYAEDGFAYGLQPNAFLVSQRARLTPGQRVLVIGDGEGRNGVWLARQGLDVVSVDQSDVGLTKAQQLAQQAGVSITTHCTDLAEWDWPVGAFDVVVSIFVHFPAALRPRIHQACLAALKPGGEILLEGFTPEQLQYTSGGPPLREMLFTEVELRADFAGGSIEFLESGIVELKEGKYHTGPAAVIRLIIKK